MQNLGSIINNLGIGRAVTKSQISSLYAQAATPSYMTAAIPAEKRQLGQDICSRAGTIFPRFSDSLYSCIDQIAAYCQSRLKIPKAGTLRPAPPKQPRIRLNAVSYKKLRLHVLERDHRQCQLYGSTQNLEVHHQQSRSPQGRPTGRVRIGNHCL